MRRFIYIFIGLFCIVGFITLLVLTMPKGFKISHEDIGTGKPAIVFVYDPNRAISPAQFEQMNIARDALNNKAHFLSAKVATPQGDSFIKKYNAEPAELFLFDNSGIIIKRQFSLVSANELISWID